MFQSCMLVEKRLLLHDLFFFGKYLYGFLGSLVILGVSHTSSLVVDQAAQLFLRMKWTREWTVNLLPPSPWCFIKRHSSSYGCNEPENERSTSFPWCLSSGTTLPTDKMNQKMRSQPPSPSPWCSSRGTAFPMDEMNQRMWSIPPPPPPPPPSSSGTTLPMDEMNQRAHSQPPPPGVHQAKQLFLQMKWTRECTATPPPPLTLSLSKSAYCW